MPTSLKLLLCVWVAATAVGVRSSIHYDNTPGPAAREVQTWPKEAPFNHSLDRFTLVMFLHPLCDCSKASLEELKKIILASPDQADVHLFFRSGFSNEADLAKEVLWTSADDAPGLSKHLDPEGVIATSFGATTSGHVVMYDTHGHLVFNGGITRSRGHLGESAGSESIRRLLNHQVLLAEKTNTFGCELHNGESSDSEINPENSIVKGIS